jgi:hypothetical protein
MTIQTFDNMLGKTMTSVTGTQYCPDLVFTCDTHRFFFEHVQDCCERVAIEEIIGDLSDLVNSPILTAEEVSSEGTPAPVKEYLPECYEWTFYRFATAKGSVTVRFLGESNGYYSIGVSHWESPIT